MTTGPDKSRLPLFPLEDVVHFPRTELKLHVVEPSCRRLVRDVIERDEDSRWIGVVLLKPGPTLDAAGLPEVFPGGTASRLLDAELLPDGCSNIVLHGDFRFKLQREVADQPYRQALVEPVEEPWLNERDAGVVAVRGGILTLLHGLAAELGERFPFREDDIDEIGQGCGFEELVNRIAAEIDVPPLRKQALLQEALPDRGLSVLSILRSRQLVVDRLRPFRHLAANNLLN
ncbi:MAG TPA: LON peptidase substrate-binding domain-containing protein [Thermoanaerobaculia bacterium]|nr:LON peptidase substrate-binding domain-containing protein [Thermoanaerobaculia bacterium]